MSDFAAWKEEATPDTASVGICFDRRLLSELETIEKELEETKAEKVDGMLGQDEATSRVQNLEQRVEDLRKDIQGKTRTFVFESIGRRKWMDLLAEHPPTDQQKEEFEEQFGEAGLRPDHNPETFSPHALAASCVKPGLTVDEAVWLMENMTEKTWNRIVGACFSVNLLGSRDPFENGSNGARPTALKSKQPSS